MYLGKVIGTVVSTIKTPSLTGSKFLIVEKIRILQQRNRQKLLLILLEPAMEKP